MTKLDMEKEDKEKKDDKKKKDDIEPETTKDPLGIVFFDKYWIPYDIISFISKENDPEQVPSGDFRLNSQGAFDPVLVPQDDLGLDINTVSSIGILVFIHFFNITIMTVVILLQIILLCRRWKKMSWIKWRQTRRWTKERWKNLRRRF